MALTLVQAATYSLLPPLVALAGAWLLTQPARTADAPVQARLFLRASMMTLLTAPMFGFIGAFLASNRTDFVDAPTRLLALGAAAATTVLAQATVIRLRWATVVADFSQRGKFLVLVVMPETIALFGFVWLFLGLPSEGST